VSVAVAVAAKLKDIGVGRTTVRAIRLTYVGELGWELHVPTSQAAALYDALMREGTDLGLTDAGHYALNSLRLEKGYRAWGAELTPDAQVRVFYLSVLILPELLIAFGIAVWWRRRSA
jgi:glycine cleavage system aminomethyltransferase T